MTDQPRITLGWRLRVVMAENRITTATELKRRLDAVGYDITSAQLSRIIDDRPAQVKTALLEALLNVLGGTMNELMPVYGAPVVPAVAAPPPLVPPPAPAKPAPQKKPRKAPRADRPLLDPDQIGGPKIHAFPIPKKPKGEGS